MASSVSYGMAGACTAQPAATHLSTGLAKLAAAIARCKCVSPGADRPAKAGAHLLLSACSMAGLNEVVCRCAMYASSARRMASASSSGSDHRVSSVSTW